jgi:hypothetical protein
LETAGKEQSDKLIETFQKKNIQFNLLTWIFFWQIWKDHVFLDHPIPLELICAE